MASLWKVGSTDIYVNSEEQKGDVKISEHVPIDSSNSSVIHFFGSGSTKLSIKGVVFTDTSKNAISALASNGTTFTLTSDQGSLGSYKITEVSFNRQDIVSVHVPGISESATMYEVTLQLVGV